MAAAHYAELQAALAIATEHDNRQMEEITQLRTELDAAKAINEAGQNDALAMGAEIAGLKREVAHWTDMADQANIACIGLRAQVLSLQSWKVVATDCIGKYEEALQEAEAILGGEYAESYGPMFELAAEARCYSDQCFPRPKPECSTLCHPDEACMIADECDAKPKTGEQSVSQKMRDAGYKRRPILADPDQNTESQKTAEVIECECCSGAGFIDERIGGYGFSNPKAKCPDCDGHGEITLKPKTEVTTMALCEASHIVPHTDQLYRFVAMPGCDDCAELAKATPAPKGDSHE
jgi:hypothetical protein